jgi:5-methylthioadenosine/S-adenosylhomocysteine deaminase
MEHADTLLHARWIIPVEPDNAVLEHHSLAINNGRIHAVIPTQEARGRYRAEVELDLAEHALIPGLINAHTHAAMSLFRGLADDLPLMEWLNDHIWPAEGSWVGPEFVRDGSQLAIAEMLKGGVTCFNDMYFFPDETAQAADEAGMRAMVGMILIDFPTAWAGDAEEYLRKGLELHDRFRNHPLIATAFAPHAPYTVSNDPLERVRVLAEELDLPIHMHVHETAAEVQQGMEQYGNRPLQRLEKIGLTTPHLLGVHMTQLTDAEIAAYARSGAHVVHCPESNLKLASGFCPVQKLIQAGINVALGTDGAASNNDLDMFAEMRTAALLAKAVAQDASALPAAQALRMATLNGARALGLEEETGSLLPGKAADITAVNLGGIETQPLYHAISQLVYASGRHQVSDVWVAGRHVVKEGVLTTLDERDILSKAQAWQQKIKKFE